MKNKLKLRVCMSIKCIFERIARFDMCENNVIHVLSCLIK